jgi:hypothetical protein
MNTAANVATQASNAAGPALQSAAASVQPALRSAQATMQPALSSMAANVKPALNSAVQMGTNAATQAQAGLHNVAPNVVPAPSGSGTSTPKVDTSHDLTPHAAGTKKLDQFLAHRPEAGELQAKNILKGQPGDNLAGKKAELERAQLGSKLGGALANRPDPQTLVKDGILTREFGPGVVSWAVLIRVCL